MKIPLFIGIVVGFVLTVDLRADELLPSNRSIGEAIDHYVDAKLKKAKIAPAPAAAGATLVRRLYLDLAGRIPTAMEAQTFINSKDPQKRQKLIEDLTASPEYLRHNATEFDVFLRNENPDGGSVRSYLLAAFQENRPWDRMFRDLIGAGEKAHSAKPEQYVLKRLRDRDVLARDVSSVFFGLNISCAQCHRHPYIGTITQHYFYGMREFFAASYDFKGNLLDRKYVKPGEFKAKSGKMQPVSLMFLDGKQIERPKDALTVADLTKAIQEESKLIEKLAKEKSKELPDQPTFRARVKLAEIGLSTENRDRFAKALVNRLWYRFYGHGLVMRVDQLHANNAPSHPELLDWLARDFIEHKYDIKRLIVGLVSSNAYARTSQWNGKSPPTPDHFAVAAIRPLTPGQWGASFHLVANPTLFGSDKSVTSREKVATALETAGKGAEAFIDYPRDDSPISASESMRLSNDAGIQKSLVGRAASLVKQKDRKSQITESVWIVLSRPPTDSEVELFDKYLERRKDRPEAGLHQMIWALVNSPEFRFNH
ncbi:MAG: DUF1549 domain-containing protein [Planctomycetes bacterium]|nr:DUF1549 domain-containing protein [Planctomycetota bacterium]